MDTNQIEREHQEHQQRQHPGFPATANREWEKGDIDWSCYEAFLDSIIGVADGSNDDLYAAIQRLHDVAREIQRLDPRFTTPSPWRDLFPNGRHIFYEGDNPDAFVEEMKREFGFDPSASPEWHRKIEFDHPSNQPEAWAKYDGQQIYGFDCPGEHLDAVYGSRRWELGDGVGGLEADAADIACETIWVLCSLPDCNVPSRSSPRASFAWPTEHCLGPISTRRRRCLDRRQAIHSPLAESELPVPLACLTVTTGALDVISLARTAVMFPVEDA